jgi:hypothetical protein
MKNRKLRYIVTVVLLIKFFASTFAQKIEYELAIDRLASKVRFYQNGREIYTNNGNNVGSQYSLGITFPVYKNIRLKSEFGYNKSRTYISLMYTYMEGGKRISRYIHPSFLTNEKIYLALIPELRYNTSDLDLFANFGAMVATEISEEFRDFNVKATNDKWVYGYKFSGGLIFKYKTLGIKLSIGHAKYSKTLLFTDQHPSLKYSYTSFGLGLVFNM